MERGYSYRFNPPAPMLLLSATAPLSMENARVDALIDSGSDMTVLPVEMVHRLGIPRVGFVLMSGVDQETREVPVYAVALGLDGVLPPSIHRVVAWEKDYGLLGRDVLNKVVLLLHGPERRLEVRS